MDFRVHFNNILGYYYFFYRISLKILFTENTHTHTHTHTHTVQKLKQEISAVVTSLSEHTLAGVVQTKENYRHLWVPTVGSENGCI
jgi:hypothetical protein